MDHMLQILTMVETAFGPFLCGCFSHVHIEVLLPAAKRRPVCPFAIVELLSHALLSWCQQFVASEYCQQLPRCFTDMVLHINASLNYAAGRAGKSCGKNTVCL